MIDMLPGNKEVCMYPRCKYLLYPEGGSCGLSQCPVFTVVWGVGSCHIASVAEIANLHPHLFPAHSETACPGFLDTWADQWLLVTNGK